MGFRVRIQGLGFGFRVQDVAEEAHYLPLLVNIFDTNSVHIHIYIYMFTLYAYTVYAIYLLYIHTYTHTCTHIHIRSFHDKRSVTLGFIFLGVGFVLLPLLLVLIKPES